MATEKNNNLIHAQLMSLYGLGYEMYLTGNQDQIISSRVFKDNIRAVPQLSLKRFNFSTNGVQFTVSSGVPIKDLIIRSILTGEVIRIVNLNITPASNGILVLDNIWIELPTVSPVV